MAQFVNRIVSIVSIVTESIFESIQKQQFVSIVSIYLVGRSVITDLVLRFSDPYCTRLVFLKGANRV